ncbi:unnamed protein product, partial [Adineta steineri]
PPNFNQTGNSGLINELEKATNIDINHDGRIGGGPSNYPPPNSQPFGGPSYPPPPNSYNGPGYPPNFNQSGNDSMINELEKATNIDLNHDGRIGGGPSNYSPPNFQPFDGPSYPPPPNSYNGPGYPPNFNQTGNS